MLQDMCTYITRGILLLILFSKTERKRNYFRLKFLGAINLISLCVALPKP